MQRDYFVTRLHPECALTITWPVEAIDRWAIRDRLQLLQIPCDCHVGEPLQVQIQTPLAALQFWSVVQSYRQPRSHLVSWLEHCWKLH